MEISGQLQTPAAFFSLDNSLTGLDVVKKRKVDFP
jgi:hypothetical protein